MEHSVQAEGVRRLVITLNGGGVTLSDSGGTHIEGTVTAAREPRVRQHDSWLTIQATRQDAEINLAVPAGIDVQIRTRTGDVTARVPLGSGTIGSGSGNLSLGTVAGPLELYADSGDIDLAELTSDGRIRTGSGDITVGRLEGHLQIRSGSSDVTVASNRGNLDVKVASGTVSVGVPPHLPTWLDLTTASGDISVLLPEGEPADDREHASLRVSTASGDIRVAQA